MGLKADLLDAILHASFEAGIEEPPDLSDGTFPERLAHYQTEAIANFLTSCEFRITKLNAPVVLEDFKIPPQEANIQPNVQVANGIPVSTTGGPGSTTAPGLLQNVKNGVLTNDIDVDKSGGQTGILQSGGYVFIGSDPDSQDSFDVEDEDGQREFTTVKLIREDIEDLL